MAAPTQSDLVEAVIRAGVTDAAVLEAFRAVPRAAFVPADQVDAAYEDRPVPIPHGQVTTQPSLVAAMVAALQLGGDERVLEVGTGYGFQTAVLAHLSRAVWSIEWFADVAATARANLAGRGLDGTAEVVVGDGSEGLSEHAPFDAILVSAAYPHVPDPLAGQLADGGRIVQPLGQGGAEEVVAFTKRGGRLVRHEGVTPARFVPLVGRHGFAS